MSSNENINEQQGIGFAKSMVIVFGVTAVLTGLVLALKYLIA